ncbi:hypothetical protein JCM19037_2380 [Geomicrobium sp. JCM 19037]|uniref:hypothetical protein n=1 Tax=unclassified Geomicrobium TaxID=2628951 RepID=UPI00045F1357|nr:MULTISPECIES: hypothetical protein [unclassified Geomicrobium]GAK04009.1 hypothetical protein JCM19037_2380 [Geomicrobium sp. JCM 19037]GAK13514.1 hypothetical protein JCM19039_3367 [Geomicrobium sp. JCM 19039]
MNEYDDYVKEKQEIDDYILRGYQINDVREDLSGALLTLVNADGERETLRIGNADARKYFAVLLLDKLN